jgi:hypothetical protein
MTIDNLVGSTLVRGITAVLTVVSAAVVTLYLRDGFAGAPRLGFALSVAGGVLTFMAFVHTTRGIYARWLAFAAKLHSVVITILFGAVYLIVVPIFALVTWPLDILRLRNRPGLGTYWIDKRPVADVASELQRMG